MKRVLAASAAVVAVLALSACGSTNDSDSTTSDGAAAASDGAIPAEVAALAKTAAEAQPWTGPTTGPKIAAGKFIVSIPCGLAAAGCARIDVGVKEAAKAAGWKELTIDPANDPNKMNAAINQAISLGADAIALNSIEPALVKSAVEKARKAGLVVVNANAGREDEPVTETSVQHDVSLQGVKQGNMIGATMCVDSGAKGNAVILEEPQFNLLVQRIQGAEETLKTCNMTSKTEQISVSDIGNTLQTKIKAMLSSNPDATMVFAPSDAFTPDAIAAVQQAGLGQKITIYSTDGNEQIVGAIKAGGPMKATVGGSLGQEGWAMLDTANRLIAGEDPIDDGIPIRVINSTNVPASGAYDGDVDYVAKYKELWSTGATTP